MSIKLKSKRPSPGKYTTLKSKFLGLENLNFTLDYENDNINIISKELAGKGIPTGDEYNFYIRKSGNDDNCVVLFYKKSDKIINLGGLLYGIPDEHICRENTNGTYYIDLIYNLIKVFYQIPALKFNPTIFELEDSATFKFEHIKTGSADKVISFSTYKLLTEQRTFYEGYGFLPIYISDDSTSHKSVNKFGNPQKIDYDELDKYLQYRNTILLSPIMDIVELLSKLVDDATKTLNEFETHELFRIKDDILKINKIIIDDWQDEFANSSLSEIFTFFINGNLKNSRLADLCDKIYEFINYHLNKILELMGNKYAQPYTQYLTYIITSDKKHYTHVAEIYKANNIERYEDYAEYLMVEPPSVKQKPSTLHPKSGAVLESINLSRLSISSANPMQLKLRKSFSENYAEFLKMRARYLVDIKNDMQKLDSTNFPKTKSLSVNSGIKYSSNKKMQKQKSRLMRSF